jgi:hypothetical protein
VYSILRYCEGCASLYPHEITNIHTHTFTVLQHVHSSVSCYVVNFSCVYICRGIIFVALIAFILELVLNLWILVIRYFYKSDIFKREILWNVCLYWYMHFTWILYSLMFLWCLIFYLWSSGCVTPCLLSGYHSFRVTFYLVSSAMKMEVGYSSETFCALITCYYNSRRSQCE